MKDMRPRADRPLAPFAAAALALLAAASFAGAGAAYAETADAYMQSGDEPRSDDLSRSRDGTRVLKRSDTNAYDVEVWDRKADKRLSGITGLSGVVNTANLSPDGRKVVTAERRGIVGVWDAASGKQLMLLKGHEDQIHDARFSPDGSIIASAARDGTARTWDAATGDALTTHKQRAGSYVDAVSFSQDGRWVLSAGNGWVEIWNARSGKEAFAEQVGPTDEGAFTTFARFSRDGKSILVGDDVTAPSKTIPVALPAD